MIESATFDTFRDRKNADANTVDRYILNNKSQSNPVATSFDNNSTIFQTIDQGSGVVSLYETVNNTLLYSQNFAYDLDTQDFGNRMAVNNNHVYIGLPKQQVPNSSILDKGLVAEFRKPLNTTSWTITRKPIMPVDTSKFKGVYLYNKKTNGLLTYLDYIDPIQGKIAGPAEQEISFKTSYDPAKYSNSTNATITALSNFKNPYDTNSTTPMTLGGAYWYDNHVGFIRIHASSFGTVQVYVCAATPCTGTPNSNVYDSGLINVNQ